jgi:hypothetical protein
MGDPHVVIVIDSRVGDGTRVRRLAPVGDQLLERTGMPPAETEAVYV